MWLPSTSPSCGRDEVLVKPTPNYNEQPLGANCDSVRFSKTSSPINSSISSPSSTSDSSSDSSSSSLNQPNATADSARSATTNNPKEARSPTMSAMESAVKNHETDDPLPSQINKLDRSDRSDCTSESSSLDGKSDGGSECKSETKADNKPDNKPEPDVGKLIDNKPENKVERANKPDSRVDSKPGGKSETKADRQPETKSVEKSEKADRRAIVKSNGSETAVDANNNLCDRTVDDDKADLKLTNKEEKPRSRDGELLYSNSIASTNATSNNCSNSANNNNNNANNSNNSNHSSANPSGYMPKPHQCSVSTSYHVYSNGCGGKRMASSLNSKSSAGMQSTPEQNSVANSNAANNSAPQSAYTPAHALNHPPHLSAGPYTIYTTGHYSLNGQPTAILSIPQSATLGHLQTTASTLVNQSLVSQSIGQPMVNQSTINQSLNQSLNQAPPPLTQPHTHLHHNHYHSSQTHQHPNSGHAPPHLHYHSASIQQTSYHPNYGHPSMGQPQNSQKNLIKHNSNNSIKSSLSSSVSSASSSLTSSTAVSSPAINCNSGKSIIMNNSATYPPAYTNCNSPASPISHHNSLNYNPLAGGQLPALHNPASNQQNKYTKIFVGGLPYHSTDKSLSKFFQAFGEIEEAVVITDRQTGKSRGYGFVSFSNQIWLLLVSVFSYLAGHMLAKIICLQELKTLRRLLESLLNRFMRLLQKSS